jgi:hypothetical protein
MPTMTLSLHRRFLRAVAACAIALAGACAPAASSAGPSPAPAEAATRLEPREWTAQSPAAEIATWARQGCRRAPEGRAVCIERTLVSLLDKAGVSKSMEVLDTLAVMDDEVRGEAHPLAHGLGISAYRGPATLAATFASCPVSQMSGCYHGVVQGYFLDLSGQGRSIGTAELDGLCEPHRAQQFIFFQCGHGMGHGLMAVHGNHLPSALQACDLASNEFIRESCWGGAFMENVVNFTHPHHTAGGHAQTQGGGHAPADAHAAHGGADAHASSAAHGGTDAHAGHGGGGQAMAHGEWKALDRDDPLYPCNAVDARYGDACYAMQTSAVMFFNGGDVGATARMCDGAPEAFRIRCFMSLGRDVSSYAGQDHGRSIEMCGRASAAVETQGVLWCIRGLVETFLNQSADPRDGIRFCGAVPGDDVKQDCYRVVGNFTQSLGQGPEERARHCAGADPRFLATCRRGAGLDPRASGSE